MKPDPVQFKEISNKWKTFWKICFEDFYINGSCGKAINVHLLLWVVIDWYTVYQTIFLLVFFFLIYIWFDPLLILYVCPLTKKLSVYNFNGRFIWTVRDRITTKKSRKMQNYRLIISLSVGKRTKSAGDQITFFPHCVYVCVCVCVFLQL